MNNPPAFPSGLIDPSTPEDHLQSLHKGMTLRDYFAAKAMQAFISASKTQLLASDVRSQAMSSYFVADAMLKARGES
jgi:hypothetical protein